MILVDTSVWVAHLRRAEPRLARLLEDGQVISHPFIIGELACGSLRRRGKLLSYLDQLELVPVASNPEARNLIEAHRLMGQRLGWIDVHLLASTLIAGAELWSLDRQLVRAAQRLGVAA